MFYLLGRIIKLSLYGIDFFLFTSLLYALSFLPQRVLSRFYPPLFWCWCRSFVRALNIDFRLHQKYTGTRPGQYILIANHPSAFEDIGIPALFPVHSLAKLEVRDWFILGRISKAAGTLYVKREEKDSRRAAVQQMIDELKNGKNIALYPEGGCKGRRLYRTFHHGAFKVSLATGVPILPVFLHYEAQEDFEWKPGETLLDKIRDFITIVNNRANCYVFDPIYPAGFKDAKEYAQFAYGLYLNWQSRYLE